MRKSLFWIYLFLSELDILLTGFFMQKYFWYIPSTMICTLSLFLLFEIFLTASFFDDELAKKRKTILRLFLSDLGFLAAYWFSFPLSGGSSDILFVWFGILLFVKMPLLLRKTKFRCSRLYVFLYSAMEISFIASAAFRLISKTGEYSNHAVFVKMNLYSLVTFYMMLLSFLALCFMNYIDKNALKVKVKTILLFAFNLIFLFVWDAACSQCLQDLFDKYTGYKPVYKTEPAKARYIFSDKNGLYGLLDENGKEIVPAKYKDIRKISGHFVARIEKKWVFLADAEGILIKKSPEVEINKPESINGSGVKVISKNGRKCASNKDGVEILSCEYDEIKTKYKFLSAYKKEDNKSRIFNLDGKLLFEVEGQGRLSYLHEDMSAFETKKETLLFDAAGKIVLRGGFSFGFSHLFYKGAIEAETPEKEAKFFDIQGKELSFEEFLKQTSFFGENEQFKIWHRNGNSGLIDRKGNYILKPEYLWDELREIEENTFLITKNGSFIFSPPSHRHEIKNADSVVFSGYEGLVFFEKSGKTGVMNCKGEEIIPAIYDEIRSHDTFATEAPANVLIVKKGDLFGVTDKTGKEIFPIEFNNIDDFSRGEAVASKNGKYMVLEESGKIRFVSKYPIRSIFNEKSQEFLPSFK